MVLRFTEGTVLELAVRLGFKAFNIESEYETIILGLKKSKSLGVQNLIINVTPNLLPIS